MLDATKVAEADRRRRAHRALLLGLALLIARGSAFGDEMAKPPSAGLKSNHNYYLYNDGKPIRDLVVTVEITKDVVCDDIGFHVQLNANSPLDAQTNWQQYVMGFHPNFKKGKKLLGSVVGASIEYFAKPNSFNRKTDPEPIEHLPNPRTLPAGARFTFRMKYDGDLITGTEFTYEEKDGKERHRWTLPVPPSSPPGPVVPSSVRTPIVAFQLDLVGRSGGDKAVMTSGEGTITYSSSDAMTVVGKKPPSKGKITAETANTAYGELPMGPRKTFTQTFTIEPGQK